MIKEIVLGDKVLAVIIPTAYEADGIQFFTPGHFSQQLGYMKRPEGYTIPPHRHNLIPREVVLTQEVLFIKSGKVRVDFYDDDQTYLQSAVLNKGDVILLSAGGHGFEMMEESEIIEVKQGPYCGEEDKVRFEPISPTQVLIK